MLYHYVASDKNGRVTEGDLEVQSLAEVLQQLAARGLRPLSVKPLREAQSTFRFLRGISVVDKVFLAEYLALMLRVGTDLLSAIDILIADFEKPAMRDFLLEVRENLSKGLPFYQAFERHPETFSLVVVNLIRAAEASGNLQQTFEDLGVSLKRDARLRDQVRAALIYPLILLGTSLVVFVFLVTFALPKIANVFLESGIRPPLFSRIVFGVGLFVNNNLTLFGVLFILIAGPGLYFFLKNPYGRQLTDRMFSRLPLIRGVYRDLAVQRFASTFSSLTRAGLPVIQTTRIAADVVGGSEFRAALIRIADEGLAKGLTLGEAFRRERVFPNVVTNLVAISEKAGHLETMLQTLSEFYASNVDANIKSLVAILEPALLLSMGGLVSAIALSIIIPIYQLTTQF